MRARVSAVFFSIVAAACETGGPAAPQGVAPSPGAPGDTQKSAAQVAGCPAGATCRLVADTGAAAQDAQFVAQCSGRFPDFVDLVPPTHKGRRFVLSQKYPAAVPAAVTGPWLNIDFKTDAGALQYMMALRTYIYDGMIEADWDAQKNAVRQWYHVPWMSPGKRPREFVRGLTEERPISGPELGIKPGRTVQNWAVGYYNDVGAVSIGAVFANPDAPDPTKAASAVGTVVVKILFSAATADDFSAADILAGAPAWDANIIATRKPFAKKIAPVRLLQMDVSARDPRATETGWVFGTFAFDPAASGANGWEKMVPVGLMWGNDPKRLPGTATPPVESRINASAPAYALNHLGWAGRMNGPVDNPESACLSCHATAQVPQVLRSMYPMKKCTTDQRLHWFRNLSGATPFGGVSEACVPEPAPAGVVALDYSLQISVALNAIASGQYVNPCSTGPGRRGAVPALGKGQQIFDIVR